MRRKLAKFRRHRLAKRYHFAHRQSRRHLKNRPYLIPLLGLVLGFVIVIAALMTYGQRGANLRPSDNHVVLLFDNGQRQVLNTKAETVGALISKLPLQLISEDVVEPSLNTPIVVDNFRVNVYRARPVTVVDKGSKTVTLTAQRSPRVVAQNAGLAVNAEDKVSFAPGSLKENVIGEKVVVERAIPIVLNLYDTPIATHTLAKTVEELLEEKEVKLAEGDSVFPEATTTITPGLQVFVIRKGAQFATVEEVVPAPVEHIKDSRLTFGTTALRQAGAPGKKIVTYQIQKNNEGLETGRRVIQEVIILPPVPRIIAIGSVPLSVSLDTWLYKLRMCETHGNYQANTGNGYYGAYQFALGTWRTLNTGYERADLAPPAVQDQAVIRNTLRAKGGLASQHPGCYKKLGISQFPPSNR